MAKFIKAAQQEKDAKQPKEWDRKLEKSQTVGRMPSVQ